MLLTALTMGRSVQSITLSAPVSVQSIVSIHLLIKEMNHFVDAKDVDTYVLGKCHVITAGGTTNSKKGHVILIMWQYALTGMGESIHSLLQMEWYQVHIDDMSVKVGGIQQQKMIDGFVISLNIQHGSPPQMVKGWNDLLHILFPCLMNMEKHALILKCTLLT